MQDLRIANLQGIFCVDLQYRCEPVIVPVLTLGGGGETAYKYKLGAGRLIYIYPGR